MRANVRSEASVADLVRSGRERVVRPHTKQSQPEQGRDREEAQDEGIFDEALSDIVGEQCFQAGDAHNEVVGQSRALLNPVGLHAAFEPLEKLYFGSPAKAGPQDPP